MPFPVHNFRAAGGSRRTGVGDFKPERETDEPETALDVARFDINVDVLVRFTATRTKLEAVTDFAFELVDDVVTRTGHRFDPPDFGTTRALGKGWPLGSDAERGELVHP